MYTVYILMDDDSVMHVCVTGLNITVDRTEKKRKGKERNILQRYLLLSSSEEFLTELHTGLHSRPQRLCRTSTFHKAHRQITGSLGLGSHDGSIQQSC